MKKGSVYHEGKTKKIWNVLGVWEDVIVESKDDITKNDDPDQTEQMSGKAVMSTATTSAVFQLLKEAGIPVAFKEQLGPTEFLAPKVKMILLEIIWRRYAVGSFLKRHPEFEVGEGELPHRFHSAVFELFLKTTGKKVVNKDGVEFGTIPADDPFIINPYSQTWSLFDPKAPSLDDDSNLKMVIPSCDILSERITVDMIENLLRRVGLVLEGAWAQMGCRLIDFKIEMGITTDGQLVVADVIDADSWRLRDADWNELSKQLFRDNVDLGTITDKYTLVTKLVQRLRIPKQALVIWRGSDKDTRPGFQHVPDDVIKIVDVVMSGHKSPEKCLKELEKILALYPEGGVILACVGMSNGLGPILSARTSWPVIGVAMSHKSFPDDVWSSLRMPSQVPMATILNPENAVLAALNILAQKNPAAYMARQLEIEKLDG